MVSFPLIFISKNMGCYLSKPVTDKVCENFDKENIRVGTCSMQETVHIFYSGGNFGTKIV